jgi:DNA processing protein
MAIPGALNNSGAQGCHHLIKQGAALVENVEDILLALHKELREFTPLTKGAPNANSCPILDPLLQLIGKEQPSLDQLCLMSGMAISELQIKLTDYELQGVIQREGVRFVLVSSSGRISP